MASSSIMSEPDSFHPFDFDSPFVEMSDIEPSCSDLKRRQRRRTLAIYNGSNVLSNPVGPITLRRSQRQRKATNKWGTPTQDRENHDQSSGSGGNARGCSASSDSQSSISYGDYYADRVIVTSGSQCEPLQASNQRKSRVKKLSSRTDSAAAVPFNSQPLPITEQVHEGRAQEDQQILDVRTLENFSGHGLSDPFDLFSHSHLQHMIIQVFGENAWKNVSS